MTAVDRVRLRQIAALASADSPPGGLEVSIFPRGSDATASAADDSTTKTANIVLDIVSKDG
jgi:hypothetical protein